MTFRTILILIISLCTGLFSFAQDSTKVISEYPVYSSKGLSMITMPNTFGEIRILKQVASDGAKGDQYDVEQFSFDTQKLLANHFGLSLGLATEHSHSGEGNARRTNSFYSIEPGIFVPIGINRSAINLYSKIKFSTFLSKRGSGTSENWNSLSGWSIGANYPLYLPQHNLAVTLDGYYSTTSELNGDITEPEFKGLTFSLSPQILYSQRIKDVARPQTNFRKGTWTLDGASMLLWNRDVRPEEDREEFMFGSQIPKLTYVRKQMRIKGAYYFLNSLAVQCDIGLNAENYNSEVREWDDFPGYRYTVHESVLHYSLGLRVHPKGPDSKFYLGASVGQKATKYEETEENPPWEFEYLDENKDGLLYQFEMGYYAYVLPSIALDPYIAYGRYSADSGAQFFDNEGLRFGLGLVAFFDSNK